MKNIEWLAGLYEGEGCLSCTGDTWNITLSMTDEDVVRRAHLSAGVGQVTELSQREEHWKPQWRWTVSKREDVFAVVTALLPYLGKRRSAKVHEFLQWYSDVRQKQAEQEVEASRTRDAAARESRKSNLGRGGDWFCAQGHPKIRGQACPECNARRQREYRARRKAQSLASDGS